MTFDAEITILCESIRKGCEFRALFFDREFAQFYGGSGATALDALAWALDEYMCRGARGMGVMTARGTNAYPGERLGGAKVKLSDREVREVREATDTRIDMIGAQFVNTDAPTKVSSAARRNASKKRGS